MNIDFLKCGSNWFCKTAKEFDNVRDAVVGSCAAVTGVDYAALSACATGQKGRDLQAATFNRTNSLDSKYGFAPPFVQGKFLNTLDMFWRKSPDQMKYGLALVDTICEGLKSEGAPAAAACTNVTATALN